MFLFSLHSLSLFLLANVTPFTLHAILVYIQMNYEILLYFKLTRVDVGNVSKKVKSAVCAKKFLCLQTDTFYLKNKVENVIID